MAPADELSLRDAVGRLLGLVGDGVNSPVGTEIVPLSAAVGRVLAEPVTAAIAQPPFDASMMDGWAVRSADLARATPDRPIPLTMIGSAPAGHPFMGPVAPGEAVRIFTGAPVPDDCDAVVMSEDVDWDGTADSSPRFPTPIGPRRHIRPAGSDFAEGEALIVAGTRLSSRHIALAASANRPWLSVWRRPRVGVLATGDEIALPGTPLGPGRIVSSNAPGLCALVERLGCEPIHLGVAKDTVEAFARAVSGARSLDFLVTSGGTQAGDFDVVAKLPGTAEDGSAATALENWPLALRPCKSVTVGRYRGIPMLGLPGNPAPTIIGAALLLAPALRRLSGESIDAANPWPTQPARLAEPLPPPMGRTQVQAATIAIRDGVAIATPMRGRGGMVALAAADHLIMIAADAADTGGGDTGAGSLVTVVPLY